MFLKNLFRRRAKNVFIYEDIPYAACAPNSKKNSFYVSAIGSGSKKASKDTYKEMKNKKKALNLISKIGLPAPKKVAYGNQDYLLFIKEIGCVIRVRTQRSSYDEQDNMSDFYRRLHANMVSPLGWVHGDGVSLYIYPGMQLEENNQLNEKFKPVDIRTEDIFAKELEKDQFKPWDYGERNVGYYQTDNDERTVIIDTDGTRPSKAKIKEIKRKYIKTLKTTKNPGRAYERVAMNMTSNSDCSKSLLLHRELRDLFFDAFPEAHTNSGSADPEKLKEFWNRAYEWTHAPKRRIVRESILDSKTGIRTQISTDPYLAKLYRPWAGDKPEEKEVRVPLSCDPKNKLRSLSTGFKQKLSPSN